MLSDLPDDARIQVLPCDPPLAEDAAAGLVAAIDRLFTQFAREDRVRSWAAQPEADGALLIIAWHGEGELSGCSKDKLAKVLAAHEERSGSRLLAAPPIVVEVGGAARCVDRAGLRALVAQGAVDAGSIVVDTRVERLGDWRTRGRVAARACWVGRLI